MKFNPPNKVPVDFFPFAFLLLILIPGVTARSPIGYDAIVVLVAVELFFAFGVGVACILFSLNMFRALNRSPEIYRSLPIGDFPQPLPGCTGPGDFTRLFLPFFIFLSLGHTPYFFCSLISILHLFSSNFFSVFSPVFPIVLQRTDTEEELRVERNLSSTYHPHLN